MALETGNYINDLVITNPVSGDPKSQGDDHLRLIKDTLKKTFNGFTGGILLIATDTGTAAAHVLTPATALTSYTTGLVLLYLPAVTNTGACTVNVSGLGAKSIKTLLGADPSANDIVAGQPNLIFYNGTNFITIGGNGYLSRTGNQVLTGNLTLTGNQTVSGTFDATGNSTVGGTFDAAGNSTVGGTFDAAGNSTIGGTLAVTGDVTAPTQVITDNSTKVATTAFATQLAFQAVLPAQISDGKTYLINSLNGTASWQVPDNLPLFNMGII